MFIFIFDVFHVVHLFHSSSYIFLTFVSFAFYLFSVSIIQLNPSFCVKPRFHFLYYISAFSTLFLFLFCPYAFLSSSFSLLNLSSLSFFFLSELTYPFFLLFISEAFLLCPLSHHLFSIFSLSPILSLHSSSFSSAFIYLFFSFLNLILFASV